ncbi:MAG TPA: ORF6N domain-containing protein [Candidatus Hydrogenedentes bacterium]|nr:ORF6N domain-containing protein [Candidatus Hydrogenedentota bacterium]
MSIQTVENVIHTIRGQRVILDADLARLYGTTTKALNQAVKRNPERFPEDFAFVLTGQEVTVLRSQIVTANSTGRGGRRTLPYVFTEHGAIMAANVLNSPRAVEMSVYVVRAFIRMREVIGQSKELAARLGAVEKRLAEHDDSIKALVQAVRALMAPPEKPKRRIGFKKDES